MGQSPQVQFTLLGPLNAGKSTLVNHNHIGVTQKFQTKTKKVKTKRGQQVQFVFTDGSGFSDQSGVGWSRIGQLQRLNNYVLVTDIRDQFSWNYMQTIIQRLSLLQNQRTLLMLGNQKQGQFNTNPINPVDFINFCFTKGIYGQICNFKNSRQVKRIYTVMNELTLIKANNQRAQFTVSLIGQRNSGKTSIRKILKNINIVDEQNTINIDILQTTDHRRQTQITVYDGPGFDFQTGQLLWSSMRNLAIRDVVVIVLDLSQNNTTRYLTQILQIMHRDYNLNFEKVVIVGNKKENSIVSLRDIRQICQVRFNFTTTHYIEFECNKEQNKSLFIHYIVQRYLLSR